MCEKSLVDENRLSLPVIPYWTHKPDPELEDESSHHHLCHSILPTTGTMMRWARQAAAACTIFWFYAMGATVTTAWMHGHAHVAHHSRRSQVLARAEASRANFLSGSASAFVASWILIGTTVTAWDLTGDTCAAATTEDFPGTTLPVSRPYPRYIERELEMNYGTGSDGKPRTRGVLVRRFTGDSTPYQFPVKPVALVNPWPEQPPFQPKDFDRVDPTTDGLFYTLPKLVYHIDEPAVAALTQYYRRNISPGSDILDICSSWVSHYPLEFPQTMNKICGTGMNGLELQFNDQLTGGYTVRDLNQDSTLPYPDESFDVVTCVVSIDYLIRPIEVLKEVHRVLRPGGQVIVSQSNRCFPTKAISMWLSMNDRQHLELINAYFQYAGGFEPRQAYDITATVPGQSYRDPMFIVRAVKSPAPTN